MFYEFIYELGCTKVSDALIQQKAWLDYLSRGTVTVWLTSNLMIVVGTQATNTQIWLGCQSLWSSFQKEIHATLARNRNRDLDTEYLLLSAGARAATAYRKLSWLCRGQCRNGSGAVLIELSCQSLSGISAVRSTTRAAARETRVRILALWHAVPGHWHVTTRSMSRPQRRRAYAPRC